jgi:hypothetical protein
MTLTQLIRQAAARMSSVTVEVQTNFGTVCIKDDDGVQEDIFMQGDEATQFINEAERGYKTSRYVSMDECYLWQAEQYVENLWN